MVPARIAGSLIGRGGETIAKLQTTTGTFIKLSQKEELYPGSNARTCMVKGSASTVKRGIFGVLETINQNDHQEPPAGSTVQLAIPYNAAGSVIGKGGYIIKAIQSEANCRIRLSQKVGLPSHCQGLSWVVMS